MSRKIVLSFVLVLLASAAFLFAQQPQPPATNSQVSGVINKIDHQAKVITVRDEATGLTQEILFSEATAFSMQSKAATALDLKRDDHVTIEVDSTNTAVSVTIDSAEPAGDTAESQQS